MFDYLMKFIILILNSISLVLFQILLNKNFLIFSYQHALIVEILKSFPQRKRHHNLHLH